MLSEQDALAELALFARDPDAYVTRRADEGRRIAQGVHIEPANAQRFLDYLKRESRTKRYRKNCRFYLAQWAECLEQRDLRSVTFQELKQILAGWKTARKARIMVLKSFCSYLREEEAAC